MINLKLGAESVIAVIGGGPAGSFFAIHALNLAKQKSLNIKILIFEDKNFDAKGAKGCNKCAGVLQSKLIRSLKEIGINLPDYIIQARIKGYTFWFKDLFASIQQDNEDIVAVYRGGGPRKVTENISIPSFDGFLLKHAISLGAIHIKESITEIAFSKNKIDQVRIDSGESGKYEVDLVVGAFGINSMKTKEVKGLPGYYIKPLRWNAFQTEIPVESFFFKNRFKDMINVFFIKPKGIKYLAVTPKGNYLTVSAIGKNVVITDFKTTVMNSEFQRFLPDGLELDCLCHPGINSLSAKGISGDRFIVIGDAACCRWLKNGIESAFITAKYAAIASFKKGVSGRELWIYYNIKCYFRFTVDNIFGKLLFFIHDLIMVNKLLSTTYLNVVKREQKIKNPAKRRLSQLLWHLYTGDIPYFIIFLKSLSPVLQIQLTIETLIFLFDGGWKNGAWKE